jgi:DNA repair protein SbcC/Rad50
MNLSNLISKLPIENNSELQLFRFRNQLFKYFQVKRKEASLPHVVFSEYFFIEVPSTVLDLMMEDSELSYFKEFQNKLLSKAFFSNKTDLRWNLYLIIVVDNYDSLKDSIILQKIENDVDYARKFILTPPDILEWMDKKWLNTNAEDQAQETDPIDEWIDILETAKLTGCLSPNPFATQNVKQYLLGQPFNFVAKRNRRNQYSEDYEERIENIDEISLGGFRDHCFSNTKPLLPTKVNLLHGSNGSGKTSVLESIEYALTNKIRRSSEFGDTPDTPTNYFKLICRTETQKKIPFKPGNPVSFYKKLAQSWYGIISGQQSELNYFFHRYNFFDSEAAYRFALSESGHDQSGNFDYAHHLSRLVFGEAIVGTEQKWQRYKKEFDDSSKELLKKSEGYKVTINDLNERLTLISHLKDDESVDFESLIPTVNLPKSVITRVENESTSDYLRRIELHIKSAEIYLQEINQLPFSNTTLSIEQVRSELQENTREMNLFIEEKNNIVINQKQHEAEIIKAQKDIQSIESEIIELKQHLTEIIKTSLDWVNIRKLILNPSNTQLLQELEKNLLINKRNLESWKLFQSKFNHIFTLQITDISLFSEMDIRELRKKLGEKETSLTLIKDQITTSEKLLDTISTLHSRLEFIGKELLDINPQEAVCPLCSHDHGDPSSLAEAIHFSAAANAHGESNLSLLRKNLELLQHEIHQIRQQIETNEKNKIKHTQIEDAYSNLINIFENIYKQEPVTIEEKLKTIQRFTTSQEIWETQIKNSEMQIQVLNESGFSIDMITYSESFKKENVIYQKFLDSDTSGSFENHLTTLQKNAEKKLSDNNNLIEKSRKQIDATRQRLQQITFEIVDSNMEKHKTRINTLQKFVEKINFLFNDFDLDESTNLRSWAIQLQKLIIQIELLIKRNQNEQYKNQIILEINKNKKELNEINNQLARCKTACETLTKLRPLQKFTEEFIRGNIETISRFFKALHAPREFDDLTLEKEGLILYRKSDRMRIKAFQMSSGQRASLALSVMFAVHLAAPNAPKFLIMDEPVANMDDLHLMNLLDLLRDFALSGRQIFFTTANPEVANLFRRKFSFFEDHFTYYDFIRHSGEPVHIQPIKFSASTEESKYLIM